MREPLVDRGRWQCSGCRWVFLLPWQKKCPACGRLDYWTGSVAVDGRPWPGGPAVSDFSVTEVQCICPFPRILCPWPPRCEGEQGAPACRACRAAAKETTGAECDNPGVLPAPTQERTSP